MKKILEENVTKELDSIYGIEESKWEILNYIKYLELSKENKFANYNIIIHTNSNYPSETKIKLIKFINKMLKKNNIINTDYEFIRTIQLRRYQRNNQDNIENINSDLIIIDKEVIGRNLDYYREEIVSMLETLKEKIFIIIDKGYCVGEINATLSKYFDWFFRINKISENNKKDYIENLLNKNNIEIKKECKFINDLIKEPFFIIKSKMTNIILKCKINNIGEITDKTADKYFDNKKDTENNNLEKTEKNSKEELSFDGLIGIEEIKEEINKIVNYVKICKKRNGNLPMLHMCFTGNPGTGKTTVARIIGQIFKEEKILSKGEFVEIHGRDLIAKYVGWTAKEVKDCVRRAKGGILFIDEAYSLNSDRRGSFEDEAIATLIKEMEDNRDDLCIILAGYQKEMQDLIARNPGFESRIQFYLDFPNYTEKELYEIFKNLAKRENYKISPQIKDTLYKIFQENSKNETFANGRYVRNMYEKIKIEQANRIASNEKENINLIKKCDIDGVLEQIQPEEVKRIKIGF